MVNFMRIVFDTNVLISAFLWQGQLKPIYNLIRGNHLTPCFNQDTWNEFLRVLRYRKLEKQLLKISVTTNEIIDLISSRYYFIPINYPRISVIKNDPSDNNLLSAAIATRANLVVSGDQHLLKLESFHNIPILTPRQFLNRFHKPK